jgi:DNA-binding transcriptional LysR family regulator
VLYFLTSPGDMVCDCEGANELTMARKARNSEAPMAIHSKLLRYMDEVARTGSIRQAAERLNVAASAINRQIIALETRLGRPMFQRLPRGLRLTASGELMIAHIRQTLKEYERTYELLLDLEGLRTGTVTIASMTEPANGLVSTVGLAYRKKYPRVSINVKVGLVDQIVRYVEQGEADLGLGYNLPSDHGLHVIQSIDVRLGAVVAKNHPLASQRTVRLSDCADYPIVAAAPGVTIQRTMRAAFRRMSLNITPAFETNSTALMKTLVRDGHHVTFMSRPDLRREEGEDALKYIPISGAGIPTQPLSLVQRHNSTLGVAASLFAEQLSLALQKVS